VLSDQIDPARRPDEERLGPEDLPKRGRESLRTGRT
jgi:hypothetical protein